MQPFERGFFHSAGCMGGSPVMLVFWGSLLLTAGEYSVAWLYHLLSLNLLRDVWVLSNFWQLWLKLSTFMGKFLCEGKFSFLLNGYPGVPSLSPLSQLWDIVHIPGNSSISSAWFPELCHHHRYLILGHCISPKRNPVPISNHFLLPHPLDLHFLSL